MAKMSALHCQPRTRYKALRDGRVFFGRRALRSSLCCCVDVQQLPSEHITHWSRVLSASDTIETFRAVLLQLEYRNVFVCANFVCANLVSKLIETSVAWKAMKSTLHFHTCEPEISLVPAISSVFVGAASELVGASSAHLGPGQLGALPSGESRTHQKVYPQRRVEPRRCAVLLRVFPMFLRRRCA